LFPARVSSRFAYCTHDDIHSTPFTHTRTCNNSLKESVYKAMHPILCEYVGFQEAEITPFPDGTAKVVLNLQSGSHERLGIVVRSTSWRRLEGGKFFLTTALVGVNSSSS